MPSKAIPGARCVVLPERLVWAPSFCGSGCEGADAVTPALQLCRSRVKDNAATATGAYKVCHYPEAVWGRAFGPLGLDSLLRFCRGLEAELAEHKETGPLVLSTPVDDKEYRANAAVLLGSYLILSQGWDPQCIQKCLGSEEAEGTFACSWSRVNKIEEPRNMTVYDCWLGVDLARRMGWIKTYFLHDDLKTEDLCRAYNHMMRRYDATWIIPGRLMVSSDPVTTVQDPDPATFSKLLPVYSSENSPEYRSESKDPCAWRRPSRTSTCSDVTVELDQISETNSVGSTETIAKDYDYTGACAEESSDTNTDDISNTKRDDRDFATFLVDSSIGMIVRANFNDECGMTCDSYRSDAFSPFNITHANVRVKDLTGGLPLAASVARMLQKCEGFMQGEDQDALLVHCKGGFGRSVVLGCCAVMSHFDVPGSALLGWVRIVRPGAITCPPQEKFLKSMKGARDVHRFAKVYYSSRGTDAGVKVACTGCSVQ